MTLASAAITITRVTPSPISWDWLDFGKNNSSSWLLWAPVEPQGVVPHPRTDKSTHMESRMITFLRFRPMLTVTMLPPPAKWPNLTRKSPHFAAVSPTPSCTRLPRPSSPPPPPACLLSRRQLLPLVQPREQRYFANSHKCKSSRGFPPASSISAWNYNVTL